MPLPPLLRLADRLPPDALAAGFHFQPAATISGRFDISFSRLRRRRHARRPHSSLSFNEPRLIELAFAGFQLSRHFLIIDIDCRHTHAFRITPPCRH